MGFPAGYTDVLLPNLLINTLFFFGVLRHLVLATLGLLGLTGLVEPDSDPSTRPDPVRTRPESASAALIRELLPSERVGSGRVGPADDGDCAVCLMEYEDGDEVRRMVNCQHAFHAGCVDRWIDHDRKTCPLCRKPFVPAELQDVFNDKLWAASGIPDFYSDYSHITHFL